MAFDHYVAFGDSISIDDYAGPQLGAASLLFCNRADSWPEFAGRDLVSWNPRCEFNSLAFDGSTLAGLWTQREKAPRLKGAVLVTVTVGGNDILGGLAQAGRHFPSRYFGDVGEIDGSLPSWFASLRRWFAGLRTLYSSCTVILGNVYDPSDGTGRLQGGDDSLTPLLPILDQVNEGLRQLAAEEGLLFADIYSHFFGHALGEPPWIHCEIEPTPRGSSEVRRLFLEALREP